MDSMGFALMTRKEMASSSEEDSEEGQEEGSEEQRMESEKLPGLDDFAQSQKEVLGRDALAAPSYLTSIITAVWKCSELVVHVKP